MGKKVFHSHRLCQGLDLSLASIQNYERCICGFMGCKLTQQMEEIVQHVRELSGTEFGTKEPILDTSIKIQRV
ncbi:hypothetical protein STEG23_026808, partial [Scotinomys teguina]